MTTRILMAEHDMHDVEIVHYALKKGGINYISEVVQTEDDYRKALKIFKPDVILSDYTFPSFAGPIAFKIREQDAPGTPFIFVSGTIGEEKSIELLKNGVTDYALKDNLLSLPLKIKRALKESKEETDKMKTAKALKNALTDLQKIMNSSLDVICTIDEEGKFVNVSAASENVWGFKPDELIGRKYLDLVFEEDIEKTLEAAKGIMNGQSVTIFENRYVHFNGNTVPIIWSAKWDDTDMLMYCIAKDITAKKRLEQAFENERQRFYDLFFQAPSCMGMLKGPAHVFEIANPLYLELIGKTDILEKSIAEVLPEIVEQGFIKILDNVYETGFTYTAREMLIKLKRNENLVDIYLNFIYQAYRNNEGIIEGIFFFAIDVTEQVLSRKKIEAISADLAQRNKNLEQFSYVVSHNLRLPVANIIGIADILKDNSINEDEKKEFVDALMLSAQKLDEVVSDLNEVLRTKSKVNEPREVTQFSEVVTSVTQSIENIVNDKNIQIITAFSEIDKVVFFKSYIHSILYNLLTNSIKYRKKDVELIINICSKIENENLVLSFKDNGIGINLQKHQNEIFGLYKRFNHDIEGKGIGLFMVKTQVELMGGTISVNSEINEGTEFIIVFPKMQYL